MLGTENGLSCNHRTDVDFFVVIQQGRFEHAKPSMLLLTYNPGIIMERPMTEDATSSIKHRFTVREYHRMGEAGIFAEDDRVELIDGEVVEMTPISWRHAHCVRQLINILPGLVGDRYLVDAQNPIALGEHGEPQPDVTLLTGELAAGRLPVPEEVILVMEVADSSLEFDRNVKLRWYGEAGIPEVWIVNLREDLAEVYSDPGPQGYRAIHRYGHDNRIVSATVPQLAFDLMRILPSR